jgi:hypothetical protein
MITTRFLILLVLVLVIALLIKTNAYVTFLPLENPDTLIVVKGTNRYLLLLALHYLKRRYLTFLLDMSFRNERQYIYTS